MKGRLWGMECKIYNFHSCKRQGNGFSPGTSVGTVALIILWFQHDETYFRLLSSWVIRLNVCFKSPLLKWLITSVTKPFTSGPCLLWWTASSMAPSEPQPYYSSLLHQARPAVADSVLWKQQCECWTKDTKGIVASALSYSRSLSLWEARHAVWGNSSSSTEMAT